MSDSAGTALGSPSRDGAERAKREPVGGRIRNIGTFYKQVVSELRKVIWPTRNQLVTYTIVVLVFVSFMVALVSLMDYLFGRGVLFLFGT